MNIISICMCFQEKKTKIKAICMSFVFFLKFGSVCIARILYLVIMDKITKEVFQRFLKPVVR